MQQRRPALCESNQMIKETMTIEGSSKGQVGVLLIPEGFQLFLDSFTST